MLQEGNGPQPKGKQVNANKKQDKKLDKKDKDKNMKHIVGGYMTFTAHDSRGDANDLAVYVAERWYYDVIAGRRHDGERLLDYLQVHRVDMTPRDHDGKSVSWRNGPPTVEPDYWPMVRPTVRPAYTPPTVSANDANDANDARRRAAVAAPMAPTATTVYKLTDGRSVTIEHDRPSMRVTDADPFGFWRDDETPMADKRTYTCPTCKADNNFPGPVEHVDFGDGIAHHIPAAIDGMTTKKLLIAEKKRRAQTDNMKIDYMKLAKGQWELAEEAYADGKDAGTVRGFMKKAKHYEALAEGQFVNLRTKRTEINTDPAIKIVVMPKKAKPNPRARRVLVSKFDTDSGNIVSVRENVRNAYGAIPKGRTVTYHDGMVYVGHDGKIDRVMSIDAYDAFMKSEAEKRKTDRAERIATASGKRKRDSAKGTVRGELTRLERREIREKGKRFATPEEALEALRERAMKNGKLRSAMKVLDMI